MTLAIGAVALLFVLLFAGLPIAFGLLLIGFGGFAVLQGMPAALAMVGQVGFTTVMNEELSVIPLFILMGGFITASRLSDELFGAANAFVGHLRGGLAMSSVIASAGFASVCGSSFATAATMAKVSLPPMRRFGYADHDPAVGTAAHLWLHDPHRCGQTLHRRGDPRAAWYAPLCGRGAVVGMAAPRQRQTR
jgi:TRAP-type mannitol/chloroaromatic compound transport system permease large subunit